MPANALNPLDLYDVRASLSEGSAWCRTPWRASSTTPYCRSSAAFREPHCSRRRLVGELAGLGLLGSSLEGFGCAGMNAVSYGLICQELETRRLGPAQFRVGAIFALHVPIYTYGSEEQKQRYLPRMARGEVIGAFGLTEPHGGSDPPNMKRMQSVAAVTGR